MCVTNTTQSRVQAVSLTAAQIGVTPSMLSQRLMGTFSAGLGGCQPPSSFSAMPESLDFSVPHSSDDEDEMINTSPSDKPRPKRRRKPQKPGKTAKLNDRHFVKHDYHDHSNDADYEDDSTPLDEAQRRRGGVAMSFPIKLHAVLLQVENDGLAHIVSWMPHGRCFVIHKPKEFVDLVMPKYFRQTKLTSFQRQLNLYGFQRLTRGPDAGGYYHECFLRGKEFLCKKLTRTKVKGTKFKAASSPEQEPDFYQMPPVSFCHVTPHTSDEEQSFNSQSVPSERNYSVFPSTQVSFAVPETQLFSFPGSMTQPTPPPLSMSPIASASPFAGYNNYNLSHQAMMYAAQHGPAGIDADRVLDEAVDELFLNDTQEIDNLADFVNDWDPSSNFGAMLEDDVQLGFMLERLLED